MMKPKLRICLAPLYQKAFVCHSCLILIPAYIVRVSCLQEQQTYIRCFVHSRVYRLWVFTYMTASIMKLMHLFEMLL